MIQVRAGTQGVCEFDRCEDCPKGLGVPAATTAQEVATDLERTCRFRKLNPRVSMVQPAQDRARNDLPEPFDRPRAGRVLPKRNMGPHVIIIAGVFCEDAPKVLFVENDHMVGALASRRAGVAARAVSLSCWSAGKVEIST